MFYKEIAEKDGKKLSFIRSNDWNEEVILFFYGFAGSKAYFPAVANDSVCIISFDRPGVGDSSVDSYCSMENFLLDVHHVLKKRGVKYVKLIGHSAGGYYAQVFAGMFPEMTRSVSLVNSMVPLNCDATKKIVKGQWKFIVLLSLKFKGFSKFYFKKMAQGITNDYDKQLASNMKFLSDIERTYIEENPEMIKNAVISAVTNDGLGVCYDAYALCQKREEITISPDIPVYVWYGKEDTTVPMSFVEYFETAYSVKETHLIDKVGHMLYLTSWEDIIREIE